jgi:hypothetical protein
MLAIIVVGCHSKTPSATLRLGGEGGAAGLDQGGMLVGQSITVHTFTICTTRGDVAIRDVQPVKATAVRLVEWGVHKYPPPTTDYGARIGYVHDVPAFSHNPVTQRCSASEYALLSVTLELARNTDGVAHGFTVLFEDGSLFVPYRLLLCPRRCPEELINGPLP